MLDGLTIVYRSNVDLYFYVMGSSHENEVLNLQRHHSMIEVSYEDVLLPVSFNDIVINIFILYKEKLLLPNHFYQYHEMYDC